MRQVYEHEPVMVAEVVELFAPVPPGVVIDATVGGGGHASAILDAHPHLRILGVDRDPDAVEAASETLARFGDRAEVRQAPFDRLAEELENSAGSTSDQVSGVLFDLGVSSPQLDRAERGFSYRYDGPLDMRMDRSSGPSAAEIVNTWSVDELSRLFAANGEGRFATRIARAIVAARPLHTTGQFADTVRAAIPAATRRHGGHPAKRVFQAVRIAVNDELDLLADTLPTAIEILAPRGRCVAIAYHSGEDRIVKAAFSRADDRWLRLPAGASLRLRGRAHRPSGLPGRAPSLTGGAVAQPPGRECPVAGRGTLGTGGRAGRRRRRRCGQALMATASAPRRAPAPGRIPGAERPPLRVVGPPKRRRRAWSLRPTLVVVVALVLGSLLFVAGAQAYLTQQSVRLSQIQARLAAQVSEHRDDELRVAQLSNPSHVVGTAQRQGLTVPRQVTDLIQVTVPTTIATTHRTRRGSPARASGAGGK